MRHPKSSLGTGPHSSTRTFANQPLAYTSTSTPCASSPKPASNANVTAAISSSKPRPPRHTPHYSATWLNRGRILIIHLNPSAVICTNLHLITPQNENTRLAAEHFCPGHLMWSAAMCSSAVNPLYTITGRGSAFGFEEGNRLVVCGRSAPRRTQGSSPNENGPGSCRAERASRCGVSLAEAFRFAKPVSI